MAKSEELLAETSATPSPDATSSYPPHVESLPSTELQQGRYRLRFAVAETDLDAVLRLRFQVFNLELGEGLVESYQSGRDEDLFDRQCHHLLVEDTDSGQVVGTYRMQTAEMARCGAGFYSCGEFDLDALPAEIVADAVEVGRACILHERRNRQLLFLLWRGLALYLQTNRKRYLFGCCSLGSQDPCAGRRLARQLRDAGHDHDRIRVEPLAGLGCGDGDEAPDTVPVPTLFATYLRYGAKVASPPAVDRAFGTIDFFVVLDTDELSPRTRRLFFGD
jgi:putative hemolysin